MEEKQSSVDSQYMQSAPVHCPHPDSASHRVRHTPAGSGEDVGHAFGTDSSKQFPPPPKWHQEHPSTSMHALHSTARVQSRVSGHIAGLDTGVPLQLPLAMQLDVAVQYSQSARRAQSEQPDDDSAAHP